ncbi:MAG: hypothetical protein J6A36_00245 [Clostridia bacterium]|nr:hypothetical protein [Clostridia bacterium]
MAPVDDIIINKQIPQKKKGKGILVLLFLLLIVLAGLCGAYYWYTNNLETPKTAFFRYIVQTNIPEITNTDIYYNILEKINTESYETSTIANFTTNKETEFTKNVDVSKFDFKLITRSNKETEDAYLGANIIYSSNDVFDLKLISTKDNVAIGSTEVLDKYIATAKDNLANSLNRTAGIETDVDSYAVANEVDKFVDSRINLDEEYKTQKLNEYVSILLEKIPDEAVTLTEASPITINSEVINTDAYTLTLDANTCNAIAKEVITKLKNDETFLNKLVTGNEEEIVEEEKVETPKPINIQPIGGETEEHQTTQIVGEDNLEEPETNPITIAPVQTEGEDFEDDEALIEEEEQESILYQIFGAILLNQKLDMSKEDLQTKLQEELDNLDITEGMKTTVYVKNVEGEEKQTIKIVADLPSTADLDIEYPEKDKIKVTFLKDVTELDEDGEEVTKNKGTSFEVKRTNADMQTKFNITVNSIEEKKVVAKTQIELTTQGTKTSKTYTNEAIIKYSDNKTDYKINVKNTIDFKKVNIAEELTEENTIFVDNLSDEEAQNLYSSIVTKLMELYSEKILNLNFIDVNSIDGNVEQPEPVEIPTREPATTDSGENPEEAEEEEATQSISKIEARDLLVAKIEAMMADAEEHEEEFTILNLQLLPEELDGHPVSAEVTNEKATVKVAEYIFYIDKDFMLTEE